MTASRRISARSGISLIDNMGQGYVAAGARGLRALADHLVVNSVGRNHHPGQGYLFHSPLPRVMMHLAGPMRVSKQPAREPGDGQRLRTPIRERGGMPQPLGQTPLAQGVSLPQVRRSESLAGAARPFPVRELRPSGVCDRRNHLSREQKSPAGVVQSHVVRDQPTVRRERSRSPEGT